MSPCIEGPNYLEDILDMNFIVEFCRAKLSGVKVYWVSLVYLSSEIARIRGHSFPRLTVIRGRNGT